LKYPPKFCSISKSFFGEPTLPGLLRSIVFHSWFTKVSLLAVVSITLPIANITNTSIANAAPNSIEINSISEVSCTSVEILFESSVPKKSLVNYVITAAVDTSVGQPKNIKKIVKTKATGLITAEIKNLNPKVAYKFSVSAKTNKGKMINSEAVEYSSLCNLMELLSNLPADWGNPKPTPTPIPTPVVYTVGQTGPGGGKVFYVAPGGGTFACGPTRSATCRYLEAAPTSGTNAWTDLQYAWSGNGSVEIGATAQGTAIGTGYANTLAIVGQSGGGNTAARAGTISRAYGGPNNLTDWFLPSRDELNQFYVARTTVGGFVEVGTYWSSTESWDFDANIQTFDFAGGRGNMDKSLAFYVRPVRAF
jgi:hypothetical protein